MVRCAGPRRHSGNIPGPAASARLQRPGPPAPFKFIEETGRALSGKPPPPGALNNALGQSGFLFTGFSATWAGGRGTGLGKSALQDRQV